MDDLTSPAYADEIRNKIDVTRTYNQYEHYGATNMDAAKPHGTSHISIIAPNGDAVSVTSSINY